MTRQFRAWIAIAAFVGGLALPWLGQSHEWFDDDAACGQTTYLGSNSPTQLTTATKAAVPLSHCPYCHWQRAVGGATVSAIQTPLPWLEFVELAAVPSAPHVRTSPDQHGPSRAPPSAFVS